MELPLAACRQHWPQAGLSDGGRRQLDFARALSFNQRLSMFLHSPLRSSVSDVRFGRARSMPGLSKPSGLSHQMWMSSPPWPKRNGPMPLDWPLGPSSEVFCLICWARQRNVSVSASMTYLMRQAFGVMLGVFVFTMWAIVENTRPMNVTALKHGFANVPTVIKDASLLALKHPCAVDPSGSVGVLSDGHQPCRGDLADPRKTHAG
jgi:hypothetical protein